MLDGEIIKESRVVVVASDKQNPVVRHGQTGTIAVIDVLIIALLFKPEATVTSNDNHRVRHSILDAALENKHVKLAMNIATDDNAFSLWKIKDSCWIHHKTILSDLTSFQQISYNDHINIDTNDHY